MLTLRTTVWDYRPLLSAGEVQENTPVFDVTLDDQEEVASLWRQFDGLERLTPMRGGSAMFDCYRYRIAFSLDEKLIQIYAGSSNVGTWLVQEENGERGIIRQPRALLEDLYWSVGMPVWVGPQGRLMTPEERRRASTHAPESN